MRAPWSDRQSCSHNVSQTFKRVMRLSCERVRLPTVVKIPQNRERGFWGQKTLISQCPKKGRFESKIPISLQGWGFFDSKRPFLRRWEMGFFLTPKPSFPGFGYFDPCAECTAVAAIQLRLRMRILTCPENSLANFSDQIPNKKLQIKCCEGIR